MVLAWAIRLHPPGPGLTRPPGTDDTEAVMKLLFSWHLARKLTTERLHS
jgi:hypothetical protein